MGELDGKVAIVTGGASGLGRGMVELFVREGARVLIADVDVAGGGALAGALGASAAYLRTDVSDPDQVQAAVDGAVARFGGLHVMVNNAGTPQAGVPSFLDDPLDDFGRVMGINVHGVMVGTQRAARHMARNGGGSIVNVSSIAGTVKGLSVFTYRASKAAVNHFSQCAAIDLAQHGIRVNVLVPGHIRTAITNRALGSLPPEKVAAIEAATQPVWDSNKPLKVYGLPEDAAEACLFLASDRSRYTTGALLPVDGGVSVGDTVNHLRELVEAMQRAMEED